MREHVFASQILALVKEECSIDEVFGEDTEEQIDKYLEDTDFVPKRLREVEDTLAVVETENDAKDGRIVALEEEVDRLKNLLQTERKRKAHHVSPTRR